MTAIITITDDEIIIAPLAWDEDLPPELDALETPEIDGDEDFGPVALLLDHDEDEQRAALRLALGEIAWARRGLRGEALFT